MSDFPKTYICRCGSAKTVSQMATKEVYPSHQGDTHLEVQGVLIGNPNAVSIAPRVIVSHLDICYDCGRRYVTRVEIQQGTVKMQSNPLQNRFGKL